MSETTNVRAVLFAKDLKRMAGFYSETFGMKRTTQDEYHAVLQRSGFELVVQQIPHHIAAEIEISAPPVLREDGAIRLDYAVESIDASRALAKSWGGGIGDAPPAWADRDARFYLGFDPEGNVFGVSQPAAWGDGPG